MVAGERAGDVDGLVAVAAEERLVLDAEDEGRLLLADVAAREAAGTGGRVSAFGTCGRVLCRRAKTASWVDAWRPRPSGGGGRVLAAQPSPRLSASEAASWRRRPGGVGGRDLAQPRPRLGAWRRRPGGGGGGGGGVLAAAEATTWLSRIPARRVEAVSWRRWRQGRRVWQQWRPARLLRPARYRNRGVASRLPRTLSRAEWWALARLSVEGE